MDSKNASRLAHRAVGLALTALGQLGCGDFTPQQTPPVASDAGPVFNNCPASAFVDRSGASADRTVSFGGMNGSPAFNYAPRCIRVAPGQTVSFVGSFTVHPLSPGQNPTHRTTGSPNNPITETASGAMASFTFAAAGTYPFFCEQHFNAGMVGAVLVE